MTELETFNRKIENYIWSSLLNPADTPKIIEEVDKYTNKVLTNLFNRDIDESSKIKILYDFRNIFSKVINLDLIKEQNNKFFINRLLFFKKLKTIKSPYNLFKFSKLVDSNSSVSWESMYKKFTPSSEVLKAINIKNTEKLNSKRANLTELNLDLTNFEEFLVELYN